MDLTYKTLKGKKLYDIPDEICEKMLHEATKALKHRYPDPDKGYAMAVLTDKGTIYEGVSYGSDTHTLTMHSEAIALAHAALHGEKNIVAITGPNCHICKQLIYESSLHSGIDVLIIMKEGDKIVKVPISELMPYPWPEE